MAEPTFRYTWPFLQLSRMSLELRHLILSCYKFLLELSEKVCKAVRCGTSMVYNMLPEPGSSAAPHWPINEEAVSILPLSLTLRVTGIRALSSRSYSLFPSLCFLSSRSVFSYQVLFAHLPFSYNLMSSGHHPYDILRRAVYTFPKYAFLWTIKEFSNISQFLYD
jgi:hypothetical protein